MTTGRNSWEGQLNVVLQIPGVGSGSLPSAGGGQLSSPAMNDMAQHLRKISADSAKQGNTFDRSLAKVGIKFNLAAILKQSQIFTSTLGSLFQIFGAAADIFLAAFMPILIPAIRWLAGQLPGFKDLIQGSVGNIIDILLTVREYVKGIFSSGKQTAENILVMAGFSPEGAEKLTNLKIEEAMAVGGAAGFRMSNFMSKLNEGQGMKGGSFMGRWGNRLGAIAGGKEFLEWAQGDWGWSGATEGLMGGGAAAGMLASRTRPLAHGLGIGAQIVEAIREGFAGQDQTNNIYNDGVLTETQMRKNKDMDDNDISLIHPADR